MFFLKIKYNVYPIIFFDQRCFASDWPHGFFFFPKKIKKRFNRWVIWIVDWCNACALVLEHVSHCYGKKSVTVSITHCPPCLLAPGIAIEYWSLLFIYLLFCYPDLFIQDLTSSICSMQSTSHHCLLHQNVILITNCTMSDSINHI